MLSVQWLRRAVQLQTESLLCLRCKFTCSSSQIGACAIRCLSKPSGSFSAITAGQWQPHHWRTPGAASSNTASDVQPGCVGRRNRLVRSCITPVYTKFRESLCHCEQIHYLQAKEIILETSPFHRCWFFISIQKIICASQPEHGAKVVTALILTKCFNQKKEMSEFVQSSFENTLAFLL